MMTAIERNFWTDLVDDVTEQEPVNPQFVHAARVLVGKTRQDAATFLICLGYTMIQAAQVLSGCVSNVTGRVCGEPKTMARIMMRVAWAGKKNDQGRSGKNH